MAYWISTALVCALLSASSISYLTHKETIVGVRDLGFPDHFRVQLAVLKLLAAMVLIAPSVPQPVREWAYAGVGLFLVTAIVAHESHGDSRVLHAINAGFLALLVVSRMQLATRS